MLPPILVKYTRRNPIPHGTILGEVYNENEKDSTLLATYIRNTEWFLKNANELEKEDVTGLIGTLEADRKSNKPVPEDCLKQALEEMYEQELRAHQYSMASQSATVALKRDISIVIKFALQFFANEIQ